MPDLTIAQRVEAGAAWLDEHKPGWWHTINLDTLDIGSSCNCVLGQTYGDYTESPFLARWDADDWQNYLGAVRGFNSSADVETREQEQADIAALTVAWRTLIEERRSGVPA